MIMRAKKKATPAFPRRQWKINPVTRVKPSGRAYNRRAVKKILPSKYDE